MNQNDFIEINCNLCGSNSYDILYKYREPKESIPLENKYSAAKSSICNEQIVKCKKCHLVYINPRPKADLIQKACSDGDDTTYVSQEKGRILAFEKNIHLLKKYAPSGNLLDVGCAAGFFVKVANDNGYNAQGIEPNRWLANYGSEKFGIKLTNGFLGEANISPKEFDLITMWDVIEHMPDPKKGLLDANKMLKSKGILLVSTPKFDSLFSKIMKRNWWFLLSHHLYYFTEKSIRSMLEATGFEVLAVRRHIQYLQLGYMLDMGARLFNNPLIGLPVKLAAKIANVMGVSKINVPYYASQIDIIARKK